MTGGSGAAADPGTGHRLERLARAALSAVVEPGSAAVLASVREHGADLVLERLRSGDRALDRDGRLAPRLAGVDPERLLDEAASSGNAFVGPGDRAWPVGLDDLRRVGKDRAGDVPLGLWMRGAGECDPAPSRCVAIVGSRAASTYGLAVAGELALGLSEHGWTIVSGAAYGIDAAAHRGALLGSGRTVAVLAGGPDVAYPRGHAALLERVAAEGTIASELPPGSHVTRSRFLVRNRLVAAWAVGTVVVEAGPRSGALSTVTWAEGMARQVAATPGPVTSALSDLPHRLIREGRAVLVTTPDEVLELFGPLGADLLPTLPVTPTSPWDALGEHARAVGDAMPGRGDRGVAELVAQTGLAVPAVVVALDALVRAGICAGDGARWHLTVERRRSSSASEARVDGAPAWRA